MRNVSLVPCKDFGEPSWRLISDSGDEVASFATFQKALIKQGHPYKTRKVYSERLAAFIDYLFEAAQVLNTHPSKKQLLELVQGYPAALTFGAQTSDRLTKTLCERLGLGGYSQAYRNQSYAALEIFFDLSERQRQLDAALGRAHATDEAPLIDLPRQAIPDKQRAAMVANSMLAGCIAGGPRMMDKSLFSGSYAASGADEDWPGKAFPYDKVLDLIHAPKRYRDRALYALLAASGCRISEAQQVCMPDIDPARGTIKLIDPANRAAKFYGFLTQEQIKKHLVWKGRKTTRTFLISPFEEEFWKYLQLYLDKEYLPGARHPFLFQQIHHKTRGQPLVLARYDSIWQQFKKHAAAVGCPDFSPHSLRHMYGTYLVNFAPNLQGGHGLKLALVSLFMGHKKRSTTEGYALPDRGLAIQELTFANTAIYDGLTSRTQLQLRIDTAERNLARLRKLEAMQGKSEEALQLEWLEE